MNRIVLVSRALRDNLSKISKLALNMLSNIEHTVLLSLCLKLTGCFGKNKKRPRQFISANLLTLGD